MQDKVIYDWGQTPPTAPSTRRADPLGWIAASLLAGAAAAFLAMVFVWRPLPGLMGPPGSLGEHMTALWQLLAHKFWRGGYSQEARAYLAALGQLGDPERVALIWRGGLAAWAACMPSVFLFESYMTPRDSLMHMRGSMRHEGAEAIEHLNATLAGRAKRRPDHEIAPSVPYPADMWTRHVLVVGGVGSGKSTAMKPLIDKVVKAGEPLILFDPKGEFTKGFARPALIAPWDRRTCSWDVAKDMRNIGDMRRFAAAMIREGQDPMWANASRQILVGFMIYLRKTRGTNWGWRELADLLAIPQGNLLPIMTKYHPEAIRAVERASVTTHGILINLSSFCASIFDLADAWGEVPVGKRISFVEWTRGAGKHRQVILQGHGAYPDITRGYVEGIVAVISAMVNSVEMDDDPNRKLWFIADELGQMGKIPIRPLFEVGRSRGVRCVVACQDLAQLEEIHGAQMIKALVSMSGTVLVGQMMQGDTAEQMAKALGTREVERANVSSSYAGTGGSSNRSTTLSFARDELAIYKPSELASRLGLTADGLGVKLALFTGGHAYELFWPKFDMRDERPAHVPAEWTLAMLKQSRSEQLAPDSAEPAGLSAKSDGEAILSPPFKFDVAHVDGMPASRLESTAETAARGDAAAYRSITDDGDRRDIPSVEKSLDSDARASQLVPERVQSGGGESEVERLMRETLEVVPARSYGQETGHVFPSEHGGPFAGAMGEASMNAIGLDVVGAAAGVAHAIDFVSDRRPGPKEEVRSVQRLDASTQFADPSPRLPIKAAQQPTRSSK